MQNLSLRKSRNVLVGKFGNLTINQVEAGLEVTLFYSRPPESMEAKWDDFIRFDNFLERLGLNPVKHENVATFDFVPDGKNIFEDDVLLPAGHKNLSKGSARALTASASVNLTPQNFRSEGSDISNPYFEVVGFAEEGIKNLQRRLGTSLPSDMTGADVIRTFFSRKFSIPSNRLLGSPNSL